MRKSVTYIDDIAKELAEEHGLEYNEALEICKLSTQYAYELTKDPNVITIRFPNLGNLHINWFKTKNAYKHDGSYRYWAPVLDAQLDKVQELKEEHKDLVHHRRSLYTRFKKYFFPKRKVRKYKSKKEVFKLLEEEQNGIR